LGAWQNLLFELSFFRNIRRIAEKTMAHAWPGKWGNTLAVRLPGDIVRAAGLRDGDHVEIEAQADGV
jgi:hypothetical protein